MPESTVSEMQARIAELERELGVLTTRKSSVRRAIGKKPSFKRVMLLCNCDLPKARAYSMAMQEEQPQHVKLYRKIQFKLDAWLNKRAATTLCRYTR